jgi:hypothetical protein
VACAPEQRRGLVHDPAGHADGAQLGPLRRLREGHRLELEVGDRAEGDSHSYLERGRRREAGADGQRRTDVAFDPDRRASEQGELDRDRGHIAAPAAALERGSVRGCSRGLVVAV